ncbi:2483_t:CDS:1, partial [Gigaspora rosea]
LSKISSLGKKGRHSFTQFIIQLNEKANKSNKYCICKLQKETTSFTNALQNKFLNKKERVISHLRSCQYFWNAYGEKRENKILNSEEDPPEPLNNWQDNSEHNTEPSS